jgi:hypothetical protein
VREDNNTQDLRNSSVGEFRENQSLFVIEARRRAQEKADQPTLV